MLAASGYGDDHIRGETLARKTVISAPQWSAPGAPMTYYHAKMVDRTFDDALAATREALAQ